MTDIDPIADIDILAHVAAMKLKTTISVSLAICLCSCSYQGEPTSLSVFCKEVDPDNSNAVFFAMAKAAKQFDYDMVVNREEIELLEGREPRPHNQSLLLGLLEDEGQYVLGFSSGEVHMNSYDLAFYSRTNPEFRDYVSAAVAQALEPKKVFEVEGNAYDSSRCGHAVAGE